MKKRVKNKKILIFGRGQIGQMYHAYFSQRDYNSYLSTADITKTKQLAASVRRSKPDIVINAAAKTSLEWVEKNKLKAFDVNVLGADSIAKICDEHKLFFLHLSSGCIFESKSAKDVKKEVDTPNPAAFYSWTKVWAENLITSRKNLKYLILRPRQPVSSEVSEKNMLIKMLTFSKFVGEDGGWNSGTVLEDLMWITEKLLKKNARGIYHVANGGYTTPYKIAILLKKYVNPDMKFDKISHKELDSIMPVKRVATVLDISKLKSIGIRPDNYEKRLESIVKILARNIRKKENIKVLNATFKISKERTKTSNVWKKIFD
jgi:dTDP-4-dehydrorhamnose reductase